MTYDEHVDCDRQLNEAEDEILQQAKRVTELKIENAKLNIILFHRENGLSHPDFNAEIEISKQAERIKELEHLLQPLIWIAEKATTDDSEDTTIELAKQALS